MKLANTGSFMMNVANWAGRMKIHKPSGFKTSDDSWSVKNVLAEAGSQRSDLKSTSCSNQLWETKESRNEWRKEGKK
jgi:hypothetical protein